MDLLQRVEGILVSVQQREQKGQELEDQQGHVAALELASLPELVAGLFQLVQGSRQRPPVDPEEGPVAVARQVDIVGLDGPVREQETLLLRGHLPPDDQRHGDVVELEDPEEVRLLLRGARAPAQGCVCRLDVPGAQVPIDAGDLQQEALASVQLLEGERALRPGEGRAGVVVPVERLVAEEPGKKRPVLRRERGGIDLLAERPGGDAHPVRPGPALGAGPRRPRLLVERGGLLVPARGLVPLAIELEEARPGGAGSGPVVGLAEQVHPRQGLFQPRLGLGPRPVEDGPLDLPHDRQRQGAWIRQLDGHALGLLEQLQRPRVPVEPVEHVAMEKPRPRRLRPLAPVHRARPLQQRRGDPVLHAGLLDLLQRRLLPQGLHGILAHGPGGCPRSPSFARGTREESGTRRVARESAAWRETVERFAVRSGPARLLRMCPTCPCSLLPVPLHAPSSRGGCSRSPPSRSEAARPPPAPGSPVRPRCKQAPAARPRRPVGRRR